MTRFGGRCLLVDVALLRFFKDALAAGSQKYRPSAAAAMWFKGFSFSLASFQVPTVSTERCARLR